ncbi:MAG: alpha-glucuronidase [Actinomycetota bacterium]|nr:alpha-glucuronidase [Actinomycetota bacterium]
MAVTQVDSAGAHAAWLPDEAFQAVGSRRVLVHGSGLLAETVASEVARACERYGGSVRRSGDRPGTAGQGDTDDVDLVLALVTDSSLPLRAAVLAGESPVGETPVGDPSSDLPGAPGTDAPGVGVGPEGFLLARQDDVTVVLAEDQAGLLYGFFHVVRLGEQAFGAGRRPERHAPVMRRRMLNHWDNVDAHPVMGQVERGYSGGSIFWEEGSLRDLTRVRAYARLLAACGINAISVNNVNVHTTEARLLTDRLGDVASIAAAVRPYGIRVHLSISFASPVVLGGLSTSDPVDDEVRAWWAETTRRVYDTIPDFGGYVVKADSEGQPGPFAYGRSHADGANALADALAPFGGVVHWRAFVYNHHQDWRDRSTDRARAAFDHFTPLDGEFRDNAILQVKNGPIDFQAREPVSPVIAAMPRTRLAVELQVTQEYTGHQFHVCYLPTMWSEILGFRLRGEGGATVADVASGDASLSAGDGAGDGGIVAVSNVGDDVFWTGHPLAQANLYGFGRLAWDPGLDPVAVLDEWIDLTFAPASGVLRQTLHAIMDDSWRTYEQYTAPLGLGFMVVPGEHYGPSVDGYEYSPWGTYHFADRDGIGVDRTCATGTGYAGQYPQPWSGVYESPGSCPDELLLFLHHVPYGHVLHSGVTVVQHIYDTHFAGLEKVTEMVRRWAAIEDAGLVDPVVHASVRDRLAEQLRSATEWRDQINTYFFRKSGVPDAHGRRLYR